VTPVEVWDLSVYDAAPAADDLARLGESLKVAEGGEIDVDDESGDVVTRFLPDLQRDLGLIYTPENWDKVKLVAWLCRNLPEPESTHEQKRAFVAAWIKALLDRPAFSLTQVNLLKFQIRHLIERCIRELRRSTITIAYQQALFEGTPADRAAAVSAASVFEFHPQAYAPVKDYDGRFGRFEFREHFYGRVGDFDSKEEFECACWLDTQAQKGNMKFWVRNLVRREGCSFFLQKADGRFYPDFLCLLNDGVILVVEYKGGDRWSSAEDDRLIGGLWAELSDGTCRFVMLKNKEWHEIDNII
jgi:type III restriction enzyme